MTSLRTSNRAGCTIKFRESAGWDFGCNWGAATERLVWRCIWNGRVIRDAAEGFAARYSMLQHPLWNFHATVPPLCCCFPHFATLHTKWSHALHVSAPRLQTPPFPALSFSYWTPGAAEGWKGEERVRTWRPNCHYLHCGCTPKTPESLYLLLHHRTRRITSQLQDY